MAEPRNAEPRNVEPRNVEPLLPLTLGNVSRVAGVDGRGFTWLRDLEGSGAFDEWRCPAEHGDALRNIAEAGERRNGGGKGRPPLAGIG